MITEEKLNKVYEKTVDNNYFTTKELLEIGFTKNDLTKLVKEEVLLRLKRGQYTFIDVEQLFYYGKKFLFYKKYDKARSIFEACYKINPDHGGTLFQYFFKSIEEEKFIEAYKYLNKLIKVTENKHYQIDDNVYLYLLNEIIDLPAGYQALINSFELKDLEILPDDKRYDDHNVQNNIRKMIYKKDYLIACRKIQGVNASPQNIIIKSLLREILRQEKLREEEIKNLIKEERYQEIVEILNKSRRLSYQEEGVLDIAKYLVIISETKQPIEGEYQGKSLIYAIKNGDFAKALAICISYNSYAKISNNNNSLYLILNAIIDKNEELRSSAKSKKNILEIEESILSRNIPEAINILKQFLKEIKKEKYEVLAIKVLKLNLLQKTTNLKYFLNFLNGLLENRIELNINELIHEYNTDFKNKNNEKATLILEILQILETLGLASDLTSKLETKSKNNIEEKRIEDNDKTSPEVKKENIKPDLAINDKIDLEAKDFREGIYRRLEEDDLIILCIEDSLKLDITMFNKEYRSAHAFKIGTSGLVVVKITRYINSNEANEHTKNGDEAFKNGDYEKAIKEYKELLPLRQTFARVYANLGLAYMNLGNNPEAIKYLTIATGLSEINPLLKYNYQKLINELKGKKKSEIKREQRDTESLNLNYYYNIYSIKSVADLLNKGLTLDEAFKRLNVYLSEKNMIILLLARDCYARACFQKGDEYLSLVEKNEYKSKQVKKFLESLKANKLLYQNQINESYKPLLEEQQSVSTEIPKETKPTSKVSLKELFKKAEPLVPNIVSKQELKTTDNSSEDIMERKYQELKKQGELIILKRKDISKFDIEEFNKKYKDAYAFYIGLGSEKKIVIKIITNSYVEVRKIRGKAIKAFKKEDYKTSILENKKIMKIRDNKPAIYGTTGLAYLKMNNRTEALKYLSIATGLAQILDIPGFDYTPVINQLKGLPPVDNEDSKTNVNMSENEFSSDIENTYDSKRLEEVIILMNFQGMTAREACEALRVSEEEVNKIYLFLAKECYALNEIEMGDKYLLAVEKNGTSKDIKNLIKEIRANRLFYKNRVDDNYRPLVRERILKI